MKIKTRIQLGIISSLALAAMIALLLFLGIPPFLNSCLKSWIELHYMVW